MKVLALVALLLSLLLVPTGVAAPPLHDVKNLFPLAVGTVWEYDTNYGHMTLKVSREESFRGQNCAVVDTFVEGSDLPVQSEYYALVDGDLQVLKRVYRGADATPTVLSPAETVLKDPLMTGQHWEWDGQDGKGTVHLDFHVVRSEKIKLKGQKAAILCTKIIITGGTDNNGQIEVTRWYAPDLGMVKESSVMSKGKQSMQVKGTLVKFHKP